VRMMLAHIVRSYILIRQCLSRTTSPIRPEAVERGVRAALAAAPLIQRHALYLAGINPNDIQARVRSVDVELQRTNGTAESEALIRLKTKLNRDLSNFHTIQETHAGIYLGIFTLQAVLHRMEDAVQDTRGSAAILAELRGIDDELRQLSATSAGRC